MNIDYTSFQFQLLAQAVRGTPAPRQRWPQSTALHGTVVYTVPEGASEAEVDEASGMGMATSLARVVYGHMDETVLSALQHFQRGIEQ